LFATNRNRKRKFVFLGRQTINGNRLFQQTCPSTPVWEGTETFTCLPSPSPTPFNQQDKFVAPLPALFDAYWSHASHIDSFSMCG
jgi:hypothetical protein